MEKSIVLWVSPYVPYDTVPHAGGKVHNFYLKYLSEKKVPVYLISICRPNERRKLDLDAYGIKNNLVYFSNRFDKKILRGLEGVNAKYNIFHPYAGKLYRCVANPLKSKLQELKKEQYNPQIIILQWTEAVLLLPYVKKIFPESKIIVIEEDVSYLYYYRAWQKSNNLLLKWINKEKYKRLKTKELDALNGTDTIILNNNKDKQLVLKENVNEEKIFTWCSYFQDMTKLSRKPEKKNIIFYGAMNRPENYLSAIWFIENVMPKIKDLDVKFTIIGAHPPKDLLKYANEKIEILGFVESIEPYFSEGMCLVAPLVMGAGIKIKVLEALSAGIPVLTNTIGIEGVGATDGLEYLHCETPEDYANGIREIFEDKIDTNAIAENAKRFISDNFNIEKSAEQFLKLIKKSL